jgi:hypothetical protein
MIPIVMDGRGGRTRQLRFLRFLLASVAALAAISTSSAQTACPPPGTSVFGRMDVAANPSKGLSANFLRGSSFSMVDAGAVLTGLHAYLDGLGGASGSQKVRMVLYSGYFEGNGEYHTKLLESAEITIPAGMRPQWITFPVPATRISPGSVPVYLIAIHSGSAAGIVRNYGDANFETPRNWLGTPDTYSDGALQGIVRGRPPATSGDVTLSVYASYRVEPET